MTVSGFRVTVTCLEGSKYPMIRYLGSLVIVVIMQVLDKYMTIRYLDPWGNLTRALHGCTHHLVIITQGVPLRT